MYVDASSYDVARGESGYIRIGDDRERVELFPDQDINDQLGTTNMAYITPERVRCIYNIYKSVRF